jgi:hypothetical protein
MPSQFGQAEYICNLFSIMGLPTGLVVEVGAHTPKRISNSMCFIQQGWRAVLIEQDSCDCADWIELNLPRATIINATVFYNEGGLEHLLTSNRVDPEIDVLFLDIDGGELQLLEGLHSYRPKVVCVEYDNSFPLYIDFTPRSIMHRAQASSTAMFKMMLRKGYSYIRSFFHDHIFVANEFFPRVVSFLEAPYGRDGFVQEAHNHLYMYHAVLLNQGQDNGDLGVWFYQEKIDALVSNGYIPEARSFYSELRRTFETLDPIIESYGRTDYHLKFRQARMSFNSRYNAFLSFQD